MAGQRPSLYGVSIELPDGFYDMTEYGFVAEHGPLAQLSFRQTDVPEARIDRFLTEIQGRFERQEHSYIGRVHAYDQRHFPARGLECRIGEDAETADYVAFVMIPHDAGSLSIEGHGKAGYAEPFRRAVTTLSPWLRGRPARSGTYRVLDLVFESEVSLHVPSEFEFTDARARLYCRYTPTARAFPEPDWARRFGLDAETTVTSVVQSSPSIITADAGLAVEAVHFGAIANSPSSRRELFTASARVAVGDRWLELRYQGTSGIVVDESTWRGLLSSLEKES